MSDEPDEKRMAKFQYASVVSKGLIFCKVSFLDEIEIQMKWPYAQHHEMKNMCEHLPELLKGAEVAYETALGAREIDNDLKDLFGEDEEPDE